MRSSGLSDSGAASDGEALPVGRGQRVVQSHRQLSAQSRGRRIACSAPTGAAAGRHPARPWRRSCVARPACGPAIGWTSAWPRAGVSDASTPGCARPTRASRSSVSTPDAVRPVQRVRLRRTALSTTQSSESCIRSWRGWPNRCGRPPAATRSAPEAQHRLAHAAIGRDLPKPSAAPASKYFLSMACALVRFTSR